MSSELEMLEKNKHQLVRVLSSLSAQDFLKLSKDLQKHRVISKDSDIWASLDHDNLDSNTTVRYLLHVVGERVKVDNTLCAHFLKALTGFRNEGVVQVGESLLSQACAISQGPEEESDPVPETVFLEEDVGELCEDLASVSYKWEELCISLKLPIDVIEECRNAGNNKLRLFRSLIEWVCGRHKNARHPTVSQLKQALSSPFVGLPDQASKIEKSCKTSSDLDGSHFTDTVSESNKDLNISLEPSDTTVADGKSTLLEVQVSSSEAVSYQWMKEDKPLSDSSSFSGTHSSMLLIHKASQGVQGEYHCQVNQGSVQISTSPVQVTVTFPPDKQRLLELYSNIKEVPQDSWPLVGPNKYVDILLINKNQNAGPSTVREGIEDVVERSSCSPTEVFSQYVEGALIVLQGRPGSGKTTLTYKISKDWVNGKMLRKANKVFLVSLRKDHSKMELFERFYHSKAQAYVEQLEECGGKGSCFVLDGYDEFSTSQGDRSVIHQLIHKTYLPLAMVILTSRPAATATLHSNAKRVYYYESVGFSKKSFEEFVDCYIFQHTLEKYRNDTIKSQLKDYLKACSNILNICFLPLNASMICFLFDYLREAKKSPKTETEMYKHFILAIALRKLRIANPFAQLPSLECLPDSDKVIFKQLCLLAFEMTVENNQTVRLPVSLESLDSSSLRGLLTIDSTIKVAGLEDTVVFLHLTLQEYLAACHLVSLDEHQQTEMIRLHSGKGHMPTMFKFYCGLVDFKNKPQQFVEIINHAPNYMYMFHCAYETQQESICCETMKKIEGRILIESCVLTPADFHVLTYIITSASLLVREVFIQPCILYEELKKWKNKTIGYDDLLSSMFMSSFNLSSVQSNFESEISNQVSYKQSKYSHSNSKQLQLQTKLLKHQVNDEFSNMCQSSCSDILSSENAAALVNALKLCRNIVYISVTGSNNSKKTATVLKDLLCSLQLKHFRLCEYSTFSNTIYLTLGLNHSCISIISLAFARTDLHGENMADFSSFIIQCTGLSNLTLSYCNINSEDVQALAIGLASSSLNVLNLSGNNIGSEGMKLLADSINCKELILHSCNIGSEGATFLAEYLVAKPFISTLILNNNNIDSIGIRTLAKALKYCSKLQQLHLAGNSVGHSGVAALAQSLKFCSNLVNLDLSRCTLVAYGSVSLEPCHLNKIIYLDLSDNGVISETILTAFIGGMKDYRFLRTLNLSNNNINSGAAISLAEGIRNCPSLNCLFLSKNNIGLNGVVEIAKAFMHPLHLTSSKDTRVISPSFNTSSTLFFDALPAALEQESVKLLYVDFSQNNLDASCIDSLVALIKSRKRVKLDLSHNNIGTTGSKHLVSELLDHKFETLVNVTHNNIPSEEIVIIYHTLQTRKLHTSQVLVFL